MTFTFKKVAEKILVQFEEPQQTGIDYALEADYWHLVSLCLKQASEIAFERHLAALKEGGD